MRSLARLALPALAVACSGCTRVITESDLFQPRSDVLAEVPEHARAMIVQRGPEVPLAGWLLVHERPRAVLVYFSGNAETIADSWPRLDWLSRTMDLDVVAVDYRGYGASSGVPALLCCGEDAVAVVAAARGLPEAKSLPLVVYGRSIGAGMAVYAAAHAKFDGLILESPPASVPEVVAAWNARLSWPASWFVTLAPAAELADPALQPITLIRSVHCPMLVMHGDIDDVIPQAQGRELFERAGASSRTFVALPATGHNDVRIDLDPARGALVNFTSRIAVADP